MLEEERKDIKSDNDNYLIIEKDESFCCCCGDDVEVFGDEEDEVYAEMKAIPIAVGLKFGVGSFEDLCYHYYYYY